MTNRLTDAIAVRTALLVAIETEESYIESYRSRFSNEVDETEFGVIVARRRISAFKRVLTRYFNVPEDPIAKGLREGTIKRVNIYDLLNGKVQDRS
jgi:hypothetical protein